MSEAQPKPKRRFWRRLLRWLFLLSLLGLLLTSGGSWWAYQKRVDLANYALSEMGPFQAIVGNLEFGTDGTVEIKSFQLRDRATGKSIVKIPRITASTSADSIFGWHLPELVLEQPEFEVDERWLERKLESAPAAAPGQPASLAGLSVGRFVVKEAKVQYRPNEATQAEVTMTYSATDVTVGKDGRIQTGEQELTLAGLILNVKEDGAPPLKIEELHVRGRVKGGILELDELALTGPRLHITPTLLSTLGFRAAGVAPAPEALPAPALTKAPALLVGVRVGKMRLKDVQCSAKRFVPGNPAGRAFPDCSTIFNYENEGFEWMFDQTPMVQEQTLQLQGLVIEAPESGGVVGAEEATLQLAPMTRGNPIKIESLQLKSLIVNWSPELRKLLLGAAPAEGAAPAAGVNADPPARSPILIESAAVTQAEVTITDPDTLPFILEIRAGLLLSGLRLDENGIHSSKLQSLEIKSGRLTFPALDGAPQKLPFFELEGGDFAIRPDDWISKKRVEIVRLEKPVLRLRDGNTPWLSAPPPPLVGPPAPQVPASAAIPDAPDPSPVPALWWKQIHFGKLTLTEGKVDLALLSPKPLDLDTTVNIATERTGGGGSLHRVKIEALSARLPTISRLPFPVATAGTIEIAVSLPEVWTRHRLEELRFTNASVDAGESLMSYFEKQVEEPPYTESPGPAPAPEPAPAKSGPPWRVGCLSVNQSQVTISNLVPGLPSIKFGVEIDVEDVPLDPDDLAKSLEPQRIELAHLRVPSPYEPLRPVAELDTVYLSFTLGGLMRKEIEKVEVVSPTLFVGEDLFWYVDYYRKYAAESSAPSLTAPHTAANNEEFDLETAEAVARHEPATSQAAWSVKQLQVTRGKLIVAPKGKPIKGFRDPFPFNINTEVTRGTLEADLNIPQDTYDIPDLNIQLVGMKGAVRFNLPLKQRDNNLVETFEVDAIRWKGLRTGKAFLTITYDSAGIYAKYGAEAYEGYVNGEFNIYLDDSFHWDGWISGKNVQTAELTRVLCPGYFILDGKIEATLVAQGTKEELYQADGTFKNHTPGKFTIKALNGLIDDLPKEWEALQRQLTQIGLETLRDFEYDHAEAKCRFYGREGTGSLRFSGPHGSRNFDINVYDHRWTTIEPGKPKP